MVVRCLRNSEKTVTITSCVACERETEHADALSDLERLLWHSSALQVEFGGRAWCGWAGLVWVGGCVIAVCHGGV